MNSNPLSFRQLKVVDCVANHGSFAAASAILGRSKSAISKTVKEVERSVGGTIFESIDGRRRPVETYQPMFDRAQGIIAIFDDLARVYRKSHSRPRDVKMLPLFTMDASTSRLRTLAVLDKTHSIEMTAVECDRSVSAVYKFFHEVEDQLDLTLFARLPNGRYIPINFGEYLCRRIRLALSELQLAFNEILAASGNDAVRVVVGCLPSMRPVILPNAITKMKELNQPWRIRIETGTYIQMANDMLRGEVDIIIGGTPLVSDSAELETHTLAQDRICILARSDHPFATKDRPTGEQLSQSLWVLPLKGTPSRAKFDACLANSGIDVAQDIEAGEPTALRGIMMTNDVLSVGTYFQSQFERANGHLAIVPFDLRDDDWPLGYTLRKSTEPSSALRHFIDCLASAIEDSQTNG